MNRSADARKYRGLALNATRTGCLIFAKPESKINDPAKLHLLIQMIDSENGSGLDVDLKGEVYDADPSAERISGVVTSSAYLEGRISPHLIPD
jgi:hypothetical protein